MNLRLLYPGNPLRHSEPDGLYAEEYAVAVGLGFQDSLFPFEEFLTRRLSSAPFTAVGAKNPLPRADAVGCTRGSLRREQRW